MKLNVAGEPFIEARLLYDGDVEIPLEGDFTIPDYKSEIFRILKVVGEPVVLQKLTSGSKLAVEGYVKLTVLYVGGEDGKIQSLFQKLPFSKQLDLKSPASECCRVIAAGEMAYLNCRAVNSRRLDVRGAARISVKVLDKHEESYIADLTGSSVQQKLCEIASLSPAMLLEKRFSLNETLEIEHPITGENSIITCERNITVDSAERSAGDIIVAGKVDISLATADDSGKLCRNTYHIPYRQLIEANASEDAELGIAAAVTATGFEGDGSGKNMLDISVGCAISCWMLSPQKSELVSDAFSTKYENTEEVSRVSVIDSVIHCKESFEAEVQLGGAADAAAKAVDAFAIPNPPKVEYSDEAASLSLTGQVVVLLKDAEGIRSIEAPYRCTLPLAESGTAVAELSAAAESVSLKAEPGCITAKVKGRVFGNAALLKEVSLLKKFSVLEDKPKPKPDCSLVLAFNAAEEDEWCLAKRYNTSPEAIKAENADTAANPMLIPISD